MWKNRNCFYSTGVVGDYLNKTVVYIFMLPIAGKTVGPNGLKFFVDTYGWPGGCYRQKQFDNFFTK